MAKLLCRKMLGGLRPVDEAGEEALRHVKNGDIVQIEVKKKRNIRFHRRYWLLISKVWENVDHDDYPTVDNLSDTVKLCVGVREQLIMPDGEVSYKPGSIAFHNMDQIQFSEFYDRVCDLLARRFLPGVTSDELRHEVELLIGVAA